MRGKIFGIPLILIAAAAVFIVFKKEILSFINKVKSVPPSTALPGEG